ncbi:MAG: hypothetical protein MR270_00800, partial [Erysipelotrichaceae bacterium]|nr:hypothetical protein [Erysipelotrichaceae bacterium]
YINAFNSCTIQPTYFTSNGIATLINNFYEVTSLNETSNFTSSSVSTVKRNNFKTNGEANMAIKDFAYDIAPAIYNLDSITTGLNYFKHLENLYIYGNEALSMFLSNGTLSSIFTRMTLNNTKIQTLIMEYCANNYVTFDIENTKNLTNLVNVDFSNNFGINNVSKLVNSKRANYQYVDISNLSSIDFEFAEFAITHLGKYATVFYTNEDGTTSSFIDTSSVDNEVLTNLKEFDTIIAENMFVINQDSDVYWRIESGNEIYESQIELGGEYPTISTITEMNTLVSPYFYCASSFEYNGTPFSANKIYKITFNGSTMNASIICDVIETEDINNVSLSNEYLEQNGFAGSDTTYELDESTATGGYRNSINPSPGSVTFNTYQISVKSWSTTYYWTLNTSNNLSLTSTSTSAVNVSFLTEEQKDMIKNNSYTSNLLGATSLSSMSYYIYFPEKGVFLGEITSNNSSITTVSASEAAAYTYDGGTLSNNGYYIRYNWGSIQSSSRNSTTWTFTKNNSNISISIYPTLTVNYSDGTSKTYEFSEFGQYAKEYTKIYKSIIEKTYTVSEMKYYSNGNCYSLDFTYNKQAQYEAALSGISIIESYYYISPTNSNKKVSLGSIDEIKSITYKQAGSSQSTTYEVSNDKNANNTMIGNAKSQADSSSSQAGQATWVEVSKTIKPYISHIKDASKTNISSYKNLYDTINNLGTVPYTYLYIGSSENEIVYKGTATGTNTSYTSNYLYNLSINASKLLTWSSSGSYTSSTTMDALLETANSHFNDKQYGEYYGMYYAYSGPTMYTVSGNLYENNYVYRIMPNGSNTAFVFVKDRPLQVITTVDTVLQKIFEGTLSQSDMNTVYYLNVTGNNRTYHSGFYTLSYNEDTGSYYLKTFCDVDYEMMNSSIILSNERILSSYLDRYGAGYEAYYGG